MKRQFISKFIASGVALGATLSSLSPPAEACGGFFCSAQQPVNQAAERIIFADNGDGTVTAVIQILYQGPAQNFSWLLPISTVPEEGQLQVASDLAFTRLQTATNPQFNLTLRVEGTCGSSLEGGAIVDVRPETCDDNPLLAACPASASGPTSVSLDASGVIGQFEWEVISVDGAEPDPATPARQWLTLHGYDVPPEAAALIGPYLADGMHLLALKLTKGSDTGSIRPLQLTYAAEAPMIPIKLTAVSANQDLGVMTWALSSARAVPFNYSALELNEARIDWFNAGSNYNQVVTEAADAAGGQGFVTEFAGASAQLANVVWLESDEAQWQSIRNGIYQSFGEMFQNVRQYQSWNGFWDAVRRVVVLPEAVPFEDFQRCPGCYTPEFSPSKLFEAIEADVIEPMRRVQQLIDGAPYVTRLYSTLSAAEMTVDPVFVFNPDLPEVDNVHRAERVIECSRGVSTTQAPWRIELPQGSVVRGTSATFGQWPTSAAEQPANLRVLTLSRSGAGRVVDDNADEINTQLAAYNASLPVADVVSNGAPNAGNESPVGMQGSGGLCAFHGTRGQPGGPAPLAVGLLSWIGAVYWRRRQARAEGERA